MSFLNDLYGLSRFTLGLRSFVRKPVGLEEAKALVRCGIEQREATFINKVERAIFQNPRSPYLKLFRRAGCELGDVKVIAEKEGVDGTLKTLRNAGVYVTFNEFKCREPVRRGSDTFTFSERDFDNPWITPHFHGWSGGSSGRATRIIVDLEHIGETAPHHRLWFEEHGWMERPLLMWSSGETSVANRHLLCTRYGKKFEHWFCSIQPSSMKDRMAARCVHTLVRNAAGIPYPELTPLRDVTRIATRLIQLRHRGRQPCLIATPSQAIQICLAAQNDGHTLEGVSFLVGGEPLTTTRHKTIANHGAKAVPTYGFSEGGNVGSQCRNAPVADDIHISLDAYAVIQQPHTAADGTSVDALLLTALRPSCPKVLFNTNIGDYAVMRSHSCGCLFDQLGYHQHLHTIRSFEKLTGVGMTFIGADLFELMEEILPRHFGGSATDYQLVERQDSTGLPYYNLFVSPSVGPIDEQRLCQMFLEELAKRWSVYRWMANLWDQAGVLKVQREKPLVTAGGKVFPFRTLGPE